MRCDEGRGGERLAEQNGREGEYFDCGDRSGDGAAEERTCTDGTTEQGIVEGSAREARGGRGDSSSDRELHDGDNERNIKSGVHIS